MGHKMKRLLCIISGMNTGGAETFLMKLYRTMDKSMYQMDFCLQDENKGYYEAEIVELGGKIYRIPSKSDSIKAFKNGLSKIIKENKYNHVLRITSNAMGFLDLKIAKDAGAKMCIARSSNSSDGDGIKMLIAHRLGRLLFSKYVNVKLAPSDLAAIYTFGEKAYKKGEVQILHNAVDVKAYAFSSEYRHEIRSSLRLDDNSILVGHVGRFSKQKNHRFLVDIFKSVSTMDLSAKLLLVGTGPLEDEIRQYVDESGLNGKVFFMGIRSDINKILSAMDIFIFPSFYEGMPNTIIEAQANGLPCIIADTITREANITGLVKYLSLESNADKWSKIALSSVSNLRMNTEQCFIENGYDICTVTQTFLRLVFG